jgi:hypothetical protein
VIGFVLLSINFARNLATASLLVSGASLMFFHLLKTLTQEPKKEAEHCQVSSDRKNDKPG